MKDKKFLKTTDDETANKLLALGFELVTHIGNMYTFLNVNPNQLKFDSVDKTKVAYDNKLTL